MDKTLKEKMKQPKAELLKYVFLNDVSVKIVNEEFIPLLKAYINSAQKQQLEVDSAYLKQRVAETKDECEKHCKEEVSEAHSIGYQKGKYEANVRSKRGY